MEHELRIHIDTRHPAAAVRLGGSMSGLHIYKLKSEVETLIGRGDKFLVLDMRNVSFLDSAGLGSIVHARNAARQAGGQVVIVPPDIPQAQTLLNTLIQPGGIESLRDTEAALGFLADQYGLSLPENVAEVSGEGDSPTGLRPKPSDFRLAAIEERLDRIEKLLMEIRDRR